MAARDRVIVDIVANTAGAMTKLGQIAGLVFLVKKGFDALKKSIQFAAELEKANVGFKVMLGNASLARDVMNDITEFSAKTPFQMPELQAAAQKLLAFGTSAENLLSTMTDLGNLAQGDSEKLNRITEAYGKLQAKGRATMEELNRFTEAGIPIIAALAEQFGVSTQEVFKLVETGKVGFKDVDEAVKKLTRDGGKFAGMMEEQSQTLIGLWSTLKDNINLAGAAMVEGFLPQLKEILELSIEIAQKFTEMAKGQRLVNEAFADFDIGDLVGKKTDEQLLIVKERIEAINEATELVNEALAKRSKSVGFSRIGEDEATQFKSTKALVEQLQKWGVELATLTPLQEKLTNATKTQGAVVEELSEGQVAANKIMADFGEKLAAIKTRAFLLQGAYDPLEDVISALSGTFDEFVKAIPSARDTGDFTEFFQDAAWAIGLTDEQLEHLKKTIISLNISLPGEPGTDFTRILPKVDFLKEVSDVLSHDLPAAFETLGAAIVKHEGAWEALGGVITGTIAAIIRALAAQMVAETAVSWMAVLKGDLTKVGAAAWGTAKIAGLYTLAGAIEALGDGGIVMKPQLALVGERGPEAVIPLRGGPGAMGLGGGPSVNITNVNTTNVHGNVMYDDILRSKIRGEMAMQGRRY